MRHPAAFLACTAIALSLMVLGGCQQSGSTPATAPQVAESPQHASSLPSAAAVLGAWELQVDPGTVATSLVPLRMATAYGDNYWINATGYLTAAPCRDCFTIAGVSRDPEGIRVTIRARHPFPPGNPDLPISGANRLDLHVFDAQALLAGNLDNVSRSFAEGAVTIPSRLLRNADGYSSLLTGVAAGIDPTLTATALPYVTLNPDPSAGNYLASNPGGFADLAAPTGHNVFPMGADVTADLVIGIEPLDGPVRVQLYFAANYGVSAASRSERLTPRYALPEYNAKAPWKIATDIPVATNNLAGGQTATSATIEVAVWDWQAGAPIDSTLNNIGAIRGESAPVSVYLALPDLLAAPLNLGTPVSGTGPADDPLNYSGLITNALGATEGTYLGLVAVEDSRTPGLNSGGQTDGLSNQNGNTLDPVTISAYRTYQVVVVSVATGMRIPDSITISPGPRTIIAQGAAEALSFMATGYYSTPPLTEDITTTATWDSSALDVGTFTDNVLTGIGMGITQVTASLGTTTSPTSEVIVKPEEFLSVLDNYSSEIDAHQTTGEIYVTMNFPNQVKVFDPAGTYLRGWMVPEAHMDTFNGSRVWGITIDEATDEVYVNSGWYKPINNNVVVYTPTGTLIRAMTVNAFLIGNNQTITGLTMLDNGQLWHADFLGRTYTTYDALRHDPLTGLTIDGMNTTCASTSSLCFWAPIGADQKDNLLYVADPGGRGASYDKALSVIDLNTKSILASKGVSPPNTNQDDQVAVDRDGLIHLTWSGSGGTPDPQVEVWEYIAPGTLVSLYTYRPSVEATTRYDMRGIGISRPTNAVVIAHSAGGTQSRLTWFD